MANEGGHCPGCTCAMAIPVATQVREQMGSGTLMNQTGTLLLIPNGDGTQTGKLYRFPQLSVGANSIPIRGMELLSVGIYDESGTLLRALPREEWPD